MGNDVLNDIAEKLLRTLYGRMMFRSFEVYSEWWAISEIKRALMKSILYADKEESGWLSCYDVGEMMLYLLNRSAVGDVLASAKELLVEAFGELPDVILEVTPDDEIVAWIQYYGNVNEGLAKLEKFEELWQKGHDIADSIFNIEVRDD